MPRSRALAHGALLLAALSLTGCGGASSSPYMCPETPAAVVSSGALVSPANGATGVSPGVGRITFTVVTPGLQGTDPGTVVTLTPAGGGPAVQQPDSVITANGVSSSVIPPLRSATAYTVTISATPTLPGGCPGLVTAALGSFTTQ